MTGKSAARAWTFEPIKGVTLIAGPTASGKSALALRLAAQRDGVIVNADSMQVYDVLRNLTARPDSADLAKADHRLYGHVAPTHAYSTGSYLRDVDALAAELTGRRLIFVGGTGLYFRALLDGFAEMPDIPASVRSHWRARLIEEGAPALHAELVKRDPAAAATLRPSDGQRLSRALEVHEASGRSILDWQGSTHSPLIDGASAERFVLEPERATVVERIDRRFDAMIEQGALQEVEALLALDPDPAVPAMKAIGVRELASAMRGEQPIGEAIERAKIATRQYARRQSTWFRNQFGPEWRRIPSADALL